MPAASRERGAFRCFSPVRFREDSPGAPTAVSRVARFGAPMSDGGGLLTTLIVYAGGYLFLLLLAVCLATGLCVPALCVSQRLAR